MNDKLQFLKKVFLFQDLPDAFLKKLIGTLTVRHFKKGEEIIREGEPGDSLYILFEGRVTVTKKMTLLAEYQYKNPMDKALIRLKGSDFAVFGEMALCDSSARRSATVVAETDCELGELSAREIRKLLQKEPRVGMTFYQNLSRVLSDRLRKTNRDILKLSTALVLALEEG